MLPEECLKVINVLCSQDINIEEVFQNMTGISKTSSNKVKSHKQKEITNTFENILLNTILHFRVNCI